MAGSRRFGSLAFAKQTGVIHIPGSAVTPPAAPLFSVPVLDGQVGPIKEYGDLPRIGSTLSRLGRFAQRARAGGTVQMLAHPEALGLLLYSVCGTQVLTAGTAGDPDLHRFVIGDQYGPPLTVWSNVGQPGAVGSVWRSEDVFVQRLSIQGSSGENILVEVEFVGFWSTPLTAIPAVTGTGSAAEDETPRLKFIGSNVRLSPDASAVALVTNPNTFEFEIDRAPELRYGSSLTATTIAPDRLVNASFGMDYDDAQLAWQFLNASMVGAASGGTPGVSGPEQGTASGAFDIELGRHPADAVIYNPTGGTPVGGVGRKGLRIVTGGQSAAPAYTTGVPSAPAPLRNWDYVMERPGASGEPDILTYDLDGQVTRSGVGNQSEAQLLLVNDFKGSY